MIRFLRMVRFAHVAPRSQEVYVGENTRKHETLSTGFSTIFADGGFTEFIKSRNAVRGT